MGTTAHSDAARDPFEQTHRVVGEMIAWFGADAHALDHAAFETQLQERITEVARRGYQEHLDQRFERERRALVQSPPTGMELRTRTRQLETLFGRVVVRRVALRPRRTRTRGAAPPPRARRSRLRGAAHAATMPTDARLSLPTQVYSAPLREAAVRQAVRASIDGAREQVERATAGHLPHRQMLGLVQCVAQDVEAFDAQRETPSPQALGEGALEVMSVDAKGVRMRPEGLREDTRKLAQAEAKHASKGDPMAQRRTRTHDRRMAVVTANWEQASLPRTPQDILRDLTAPAKGRPRRVPRREGPRPSLPRPQNKRVRGSLEQDQKARIAEMFAEAERRDPTRTRRWVVLVDGSESQLAQVRTKAQELGVVVTIIVDVIHVLHYLWVLSGLLSAANDGARDLWVREHLMRLMTRSADFVISGLRQSATLRVLDGDDRKTFDAAVGYLEKTASCLDYGAYLSAGMPIATGVIEGACRYLVQDRMGITGACWGLAGAEAVLRLRSVDLSGDWEEFWRFHLQREHERNYPAKAAA
jgi:hypothetical protein